MGTIRIQAIIEDYDMPYVERFLKGIAHDFSFDKEEEDFYYDLSPVDLEKIQIAEEQAKSKILISSEEVHKDARKRIGL